MESRGSLRCQDHSGVAANPEQRVPWDGTDAHAYYSSAAWSHHGKGLDLLSGNCIIDEAGGGLRGHCGCKVAA